MIWVIHHLIQTVLINDSFTLNNIIDAEIVKLGGQPVYREGVITDNGNVILDVHNMDIMEPIKLEKTLNNIVGVVTNGLFAMRSADVLLVGSEDGTKTVHAKS